MIREITAAIMSKVHTKGVAVVIEAQHMCMMMYGVEKQNSSMTTSVMRGLIREHLTNLDEFLQFIRH